ncbi:hypothetical protein [Sphingomonas sp. PvP056]|uniref:hypothetical protein n=1 Tax=Sphingomonas sp. PvP056 TaxID=3156392 RepID=UPI00263CFA39|nr:hypothetical protein [Sphingomonas sp. PsM26]
MATAFEWFRANLTPGAIGIYALLGAVVGGYFKFKPLAMKLANEREANLLRERSEEMERMRVRMDAVEMAARTASLEADKQIAMLQAERAIDRHRINNVTQCLDALILLIEQDPAKASEAATRIKAMRADQMKAEALEKGTAAIVKSQGVGL